MTEIISPTNRSFSMLIGSDWAEAESGERFDSINPFTGAVWATFPVAGKAEVDAAVTRAREALDGPWGDLTASARGRLIRRLADLIAEHADELSILESTDNGKLLREMRAQVRSLPGWYEFFAGLADKIEGTVPQDTKPGLFTYTRREPVGVVAAILPWNSPLLILANKLAPGLAAGCTFVTKPAAEASAGVLEFAKLFREAGFPDGVFNVVTGGVSTGEELVKHPGVDKVAFTGSTNGGIQVMKGAAEHLAGVTLELGGKSPNIVFPDADLAAAANGVVAGIFAAGGQTCIAGSRVLVHREVHDELAARLVDRARTIRLGNPLDSETEMGPIACPPQLEKIEHYVNLGAEEGAKVAIGGKRPTAPELSAGLFFEPTVLTGVANEMQVARDEIFGPVASLIPFEDEDEAIRIANDTNFGLAAGVWTENIRRAHRVAHRIKAGTIWVNEYRTMSYNVPFGGYKASGLGRENGIEAVLEYVQSKAIWIKTGEGTRDPFTVG